MKSTAAMKVSTLDDLTVGSVAAIPEVSTWAMMALGLAGIAGAARKRQA